jgi:SAM-dependent methyltransferase
MHFEMPRPEGSSTTVASPRTAGLMGGVLLISLSALTYELVLTRIASVVMFYHFAFLAVSLALLGMSVAGIFIYVLAKRFPKHRAGEQAFLFCLLFSLSLPLGLMAVLNVPPDIELSLPSMATAQGVRFVLIICAMALPFYFSGLTISLILTHYGGAASRVYFADLIGASLGCLLFIPIMNLLGGIHALLFAAILGSCAALVFAWAVASRKRIYIALCTSLTLALFVGFNSREPVIRIRQAKGVTEEEPVYERWNSFSRVAVYPSNPLSQDLERMSILIDGYAFTAMAKFDGDFSKLESLKLELASLPYHLPGKRDVLIIGSGGGFEVLIALLFGSESVTAVEINPLMIDIVDHEFAEFSGQLYSRPGVVAVIDEGRSFIRNSDRRYDIIEATLVDTWAASQAGAYALTENYLYTKEAFIDYLQHLTDNGVLAMTRWYVDSPEEMLKMTSLALDAMNELGISHPEKHIVVARREYLGILLVKRTPFTEEELRIIDEASNTFWFPLIYTPSGESQQIFVDLMNSSNREDFHRLHGLQCSVSPSTDDRPFFFFCEQNDTLAFLLVVVLSLVTVSILVPLVTLSGRSLRKLVADYSGALVYFACLGLGFLLVEIILIQRFVLFLGHPVYAISVILFSLLFFGGLGSNLSGRFGAQRRGFWLKMVLLALVLLLGVYNLGYPALLRTFTGLSTAHRIGLTVVLLCPLGMLMGMPFPLGISAVHSKDPRVVPWVWGVNGTLSVLGSVLAAMLSISFGFTLALVVGQAAYLVALVLVVIRPMT